MTSRGGVSGATPRAWLSLLTLITAGFIAVLGLPLTVVVMVEVVVVEMLVVVERKTTS